MSVVHDHPVPEIEVLVRRHNERFVPQERCVYKVGPALAVGVRLRARVPRRRRPWIVRMIEEQDTRLLFSVISGRPLGVGARVVRWDAPDLLASAALRLGSVLGVLGWLGLQGVFRLRNRLREITHGPGRDPDAVIESWRFRGPYPPSFIAPLLRLQFERRKIQFSCFCFPGRFGPKGPMGIRGRARSMLSDGCRQCPGSPIGLKADLGRESR